MSSYGEPLYGTIPYSEGGDNTAFFLKRLVESLPPPYRPTNFQGYNCRDLLERMLLPSAEDLARVNAVFDRLDTYILPESAPEEWLRWILTEWFGWTLIPDGYPLNPTGPDIQSSPCLRRLLLNLHRHYKRRYTVRGVRELLREFGVIAEVYDRRPFIGGYTGSFGSLTPNRVRVRVLGYEPFFFPRQTFVGGYLGHTYAHTTRQIITEEFVRSLVNWSRVAGVHYLIEFTLGTQPTFDYAHIPDDDEPIIS